MHATALLITMALAATPTAQNPEELLPALGPASAWPDRFHPEGATAHEPTVGGTVTVHLAGRPRSFNYMLESSATTRQLLGELHEPLIRRDWETGAWRGVLARDWQIAEDGLSWTFALRDDVRWQDGHPFDAADVAFTFSLWRNPEVDCDRRRYMFDKLESCEVLGPHEVRFTFAAPYFMAASSFDESFTVLPAHRYDLADPDHPEREEEATPARQAEYVNAHPGNLDWLGLGPYRLVSQDAEQVVAERWDGYFDPANAGWIARIRWRILPPGETAMLALRAGELDFYDRLSSDDYFGPRTAESDFTERFYKGFYFTPYMAFTAWNLARPQLSDARVRRALAMSFDFEAYIRGAYHGLAFQVTGDQWYPSPNYDRALEPLPFDPPGARALLAEAGWYDRDGDGWADRDGLPLELELLMPSGNEVSADFAQLFQESLAAVGVRLEIGALEFAALRERVSERDYDGVNLGLVLDFESDPEQLWHSRWAEGSTSNRSGLADPAVDRAIEALQIELDDTKRAALFHDLQRRIYELQPYLFRVSAPHRFAMSRRVRNVQLFALDPGYSIRRWFLLDED